MLIHKTTDYAIRLLCCVAGAKNPVPSSKLAVELGVSPRYVLHFGAVLRDAGFVQVTGGPAGGFSLARSPENISLWDVFTSRGHCAGGVLHHGGRRVPGKTPGDDVEKPVQAEKGTIEKKSRQALKFGGSPFGEKHRKNGGSPYQSSSSLRTNL